MTSPSIVPGSRDDVYVVLDDFGPIGRVYREVDEEKTDRETVIRNLVSGQYNNPVRIVAFNTDDGWSRDMTAEIALEIRNQEEELSPVLRDFIDDVLSRAKRITASQQHA